ncbi:ComF family protein [Nakamurella antarctica]|uniref:ComF family protein n=1 Tax=Nakamurella antarctica TaxID=1902245 RepID=UPI0019D2DBE2|nr:ComF family protein [Nakamurella antarctica]
MYAFARYRGPVRAAVLAGKEKGRRDLPALLGESLGLGVLRLLSISVLTTPLWLVPAPSRAWAARARGGDPVTAMAVAAASILSRHGSNVGVAPCLSTSRAARDSVGLDAASRVRNLRGRIICDVRACPPPGAAVVLVDDVFTTGATSAIASEALAQFQLSVQAILVLATAAPFS